MIDIGHIFTGLGSLLAGGIGMGLINTWRSRKERGDKVMDDHRARNAANTTQLLAKLESVESDNRVLWARQATDNTERLTQQQGVINRQTEELSASKDREHACEKAQISLRAEMQALSARCEVFMARAAILEIENGKLLERLTRHGGS